MPIKKKGIDKNKLRNNGKTNKANGIKKIKLFSTSNGKIIQWNPNKK